MLWKNKDKSGGADFYPPKSLDMPFKKANIGCGCHFFSSISGNPLVGLRWQRG